MIILEKNILFPLLVANLMTTQAWTMPFWPIPLMALCSFRIARTGYAQPQMLCVPLSFTFLLSSVGLVTPAGPPPASTSEQSAMVPPALFTLFLLTMIWPKVQEFILKIHFIAVYVAPWQISWGSAFHAFAQPFSVPHSGFICAQAAISSILSSPLNPLLGPVSKILFYNQSSIN
uniref:Pecanex-like protein n=1 Tax=Ditylenchus dipsaci TaxID=166011 RepID=A0A915DST2_9BILA